MRKLVVVTVLFLVFIISSSAFFSQSKTSEQRKLTIFCADSVLYPLERVSESYMNENPVQVEIEGHGSIQVIRHVTELGYHVDLLMTADYSLIPMLMYNTTDKETGKSYADWYIRFSSNSVVLAYTDKSKYAGEINAQNWYEVLARAGVKYGMPDPIVDALGYRSLMTLKLAESYYGDSTIFSKLLGNNFNPTFMTAEVPGKTVIFVPEVEQPINDKVTLRAATPEVTPLLDTGVIDYCFMYLSNAKQNGYKYVELPPEINMGEESYQSNYAKVEVRFLNQRFGTVSPIMEGSTIYYGLTIPSNADNKAEAESFVKYLLSGEGKTIFDSSWQAIYNPSYTDHINNVPSDLKQLLETDQLGR